MDIIYWVLIWMLLGFVSVWITFHTARKEWYKKHQEEYWKGIYFDNALSVLIIFSPFYIVGGPISFFLVCTFNIKNWTLYFNIKNEEKIIK